MARRETRGVHRIQDERSSGVSGWAGTNGGTGFWTTVSGGTRTGGFAGARVTTVSVCAGAGRMTSLESICPGENGWAPTPRVSNRASANAAPRGRSRREGAGLSLRRGRKG